MTNGDSNHHSHRLRLPLLRVVPAASGNLREDHPADFRKAHREGEGAVGRTHLITPKSVSAHALLEAAWEAIDVPASEKPPRWWPASVFKWRSDDPAGLVFQSKGRLTFTQWSATLLTDKEGTQLLWSVVQALQFNGLVPEARSLANLERRVIRAMRACDPYCEIISEQGKVKWK